ncbi:MAG: 5'-nucleotidase C-terminal domain-containing protein, partial [Longimicrobiales bacterium]
PEGDITIADVAALYPYDNTLKAIRITGAQLRAYLEKSAEYFDGFPAPDGSVINFDVPGYNFDVISGVDYILDVSRPIGQRVTLLSYEGAAVRDAQTFTLALNNYRQSGVGGYSMIADAPVVYDRQEDIRELLIDEVRRRGTIRPEDYYVPSWRLMPAEAVQAVLTERNAEGEAEAQTERNAEAGAVATDTARVRLRVIATNDFHGRLEAEHPSWADGRPLGGAAILASYFRLERDGFRGPVILLDGGDVMQGTPISNLTEGRSTVDYFNRVGYGGSAIGNHEFDWTIDVLKQRIEQAGFPWLSANIFVAGTDSAPSWVQPTALVDVDGTTVGIIGLSTEQTPDVTRPSNVSGLEFRDGAAAIDRWVPLLRARGADFVVVIAHAGALCRTPTTECSSEIIDWARRVTARPDLIVAGHTHRVARTRENGIPIVETGSYGTRYGVVDLERISADSVDAWIRGTPAAWHWRVAPDTAVAALVERYAAEIRPRVDRVVATIAEPLERAPGEYALGRLIADAQRTVADAQLSLMNNGGIRAALDAGPLTWGEAYNMHPFDNKIVVLHLTGAQIRAALEHVLSRDQPGAHISGVTVHYDSSAAAGARVRSVTLEDGAALRDDAVYTIAVNDFLADAGDGFEMFADAQRRVPTGISDLDAFIQHVAALPQPVRAPAEPRFIATHSRNPEPSRSTQDHR